MSAEGRKTVIVHAGFAVGGLTGYTSGDDLVETGMYLSQEKKGGTSWETYLHANSAFDEFVGICRPQIWQEF